jgi:hypothetical protein
LNRAGRLAVVDDAIPITADYAFTVVAETKARESEQSKSVVLTDIGEPAE